MHYPLEVMRVCLRWYAAYPLISVMSRSDGRTQRCRRSFDGSSSADPCAAAASHRADDPRTRLVTISAPVVPFDRPPSGSRRGVLGVNAFETFFPMV
jgi:hypothetical protein